MSEQVITKRCSHCKEIKPITEFCKDKSSPNKLNYRCKTCCNTAGKKYCQTKHGKLIKKLYRRKYQHTIKYKNWLGKYRQTAKYKIYEKQYRQSDKGKKLHSIQTIKYRIIHPEICRAQSAVKFAVKTGKIKPPNQFKCTYCPKQARQYHHPSYERKHYLCVEPVCAKCHKKLQLSSFRTYVK